MTQIRPTKEMIAQWGNTHVIKWLREGIEQSRDEYIAEQAAAWAMEEAAKLAASTICDTHLPTGIKIYGTVAARAIRAAIPKEKEL